MSAEISNFSMYRIWPDLNLAVIPCSHDRGNNPDFHSHDFYEMVLVCRGTARHYMNAETVPIQAGDLVLVTPGCTHGYLEPDNLQIYNILFCRDIYDAMVNDLAPLPAFQLLFQVQPHLVSQMRHESGLLSLSGEAFEHARSYAEMINGEIRKHEPGAKTAVHGMFLSMIVHCLRHARLDRDAAGSYVRQISGVLAMLDQHPEKHWTLENMAKNASMSAANFRLHFHRLTGHAPGGYLLELRLKKAASMLQSGRSSISEIAFRTGFNDANYFSRQFHRFFGKSPRDFRR